MKQIRVFVVASALAIFSAVQLQAQDLSQSLDETTITDGNSASCNAGGIVTSNSYYRSFSMASTTGDYTVGAISVGVEVAVENADGTGVIDGEIPCVINFYYDFAVGSIVMDPDNMGTPTPDASVVSSFAGDGSQDLTVVDLPVTGVTVPDAVSTLVVEIFVPGYDSADPNGDNFVIGSNAGGQTATTFIAAAACGVTTPTATGSLGFPTMHLVMIVRENKTTSEDLTQSLDSTTITPGNSVNCNSLGIANSNSYYRSFSMAPTNGAYTIDSVCVGVEAALENANGTGITDGEIPCTINFYYDVPVGSIVMDPNNTGSPIPNASVDASFAGDGSQDLTVVELPVAGVTVPDSVSTLVVEIFVPGSDSDMPNGDSFLIGSNAGGQTAPTFIAAAACGITSPTATGAIGSPGMHMVMIVKEGKGGFITYRNRDEFNETAGPFVFRENFSGFTEDIDFSFTTTAAPLGFSVTHEGDSGDANFIDGAPFGTGGGNQLVGFIDGDFNPQQTDKLIFDLDSPQRSFGFNLQSANTGEGLSAGFFDQNLMHIATLSGTSGSLEIEFIGVTTSGGTFISRVEFSTESDFDSGESFFADNFVSGVFNPGDVNLDGSVDLLDVAPFVNVVTSGKFQAEADINEDGVVSLLDVQSFVDLLTG